MSHSLHKRPKKADFLSVFNSCVALAVTLDLEFLLHCPTGQSGSPSVAIQVFTKKKATERSHVLSSKRARTTELVYR